MAKDTGVVNIHGKEYQTVASRVQKFRADETFKGYGLTTEVLDRDERIVVVRASITDQTGRVVATGHAEEVRQSSNINKTSALENCETSAIGRALATLGLGGTEFATADEVANALSKQPTTAIKPLKNTAGGQGLASDKQRQYVKKLLDMRGVPLEDQKGYIIEKYGVEMPLTVEGASYVIDELQESGSRLQTV